MVSLPTFCIDRYEAPNRAGEVPFVLRTAAEGEEWCADHGKRLCSEVEWVRACQGPHGRRFPYGDEHRASACNDERTWIAPAWKSLASWPSPEAVVEAARLFQGEASGAHAGCVSEEGVYDLTGNVAEWVRRSDPAPHPGYDHVLKGCYWAGCYHEPQPNCMFRNSAHPGSFRTYEAGFRCCRDRSTESASLDGTPQSVSSETTGPASTRTARARNTSPSRT
jgi:formylglycine-generating enzyme required for sulfatase activity